jgi:hypothetical protein
MDLERGFQIEHPAAFVTWGILEAELLELLPIAPDHVTSGYYVIDCVSLSGLCHALGFHFHKPQGGTLRELEFFRRAYPAYPDLTASFEEFQEHLVTTFGPPDAESPGDEGFPRYGWRVGATIVRHYVFDRFGPEEHVRITQS